MQNTSNLFPISTALKHTLKRYTLSKFRQDMLAAFVVSLVALPLSMALAIAVGLPPQHGIYTAIVAGMVVPLLGGSVWQISGPTAAFVVILAPIVSTLGLRGLVWSTLLAGVFLVMFGIARLGRLINYVPYPVTTGFTAGIAVVLATLSLNDFLGLGISKLEGDFLNKVTALVSHFSSIDPYTSVTGIVTLVLMFYAGCLVKILPSTIIAVGAGTVLAYVFSKMGHTIPTIGNCFSYLTPDGQTLPGIPPYLPILHLPTFKANDLFRIPTIQEASSLLLPAITIALLAALESLLSATVADSMAGTKHDPNAELNAIGIGNILSALAVGIPATGAIARTATNINNGAQTPLSSAMHAVLIGVYVLLLAPYVNYIPMSSLAALLIHTAYRMSHYRQFVRIIQIAPRGDLIVLLICFLLTVFIDMVAGVGIGMICAAFLLIQRVTELTEAKLESPQDISFSRTLPKGTFVYRLRGPLFFGTIGKALDRRNFISAPITDFILDITEVPFIDMTGLVAIKSLLTSIANNKRTIHIVSRKTSDVAAKIKQKISPYPVSQFVCFHTNLRDALGHKTTSK